MTEQILRKFDGKKTLDEIIISMEKDGIVLSKEQLEGIIDKNLKPQNIFTSLENIDLKKIEKEPKAWFHWALLEGQKLKCFLDKFHFLFKVEIVIMQVLFMIFGQVYFCAHGTYKLIFAGFNSKNAAIFIFILPFIFVFHEFGHAAAANYYKCKVGKMGIGLYLFRPVLYTDLSDTWRLSRGKRIVTDLGGIYFQIVICNILLLFLYFYDLQAIKLSILFILLLALFNLNPFLKLDGYWILSDAIGVNNVNQKAFVFLQYICKRILRQDTADLKLPVVNKRVKVILYSHIVIYLVCTISAFIIGAYMSILIMIGRTNLADDILTIKMAIVNGSILLIFKEMFISIIKILPCIYMGIVLIKLLLKAKLHLKSSGRYKAEKIKKYSA